MDAARAIEILRDIRFEASANDPSVGLTPDHDTIEACDLAIARLASPPADGGVPRDPTEAMKEAARDWSLSKYHKAIGDDAAMGCWCAMYDAALSTRPSERKDDC